jgi:Na+/pantothenate symporter
MVSQTNRIDRSRINLFLIAFYTLMRDRCSWETNLARIAKSRATAECLLIQIYLFMPIRILVWSMAMRKRIMECNLCVLWPNSVFETVFLTVSLSPLRSGKLSCLRKSASLWWWSIFENSWCAFHQKWFKFWHKRVPKIFLRIISALMVSFHMWSP